MVNIKKGLYRICCGPSWCPARFHRDGSPGGSRSCSRAAAASGSPSGGWGPPGSGTASPRTRGAPAAARVPPSSVPSPSCSPPPRLGWEWSESPREQELHPRVQSCPEIRWRNSQPRPLPPSHPMTAPEPVSHYRERSERRTKWWAGSLRANEGEPER